MKYTVTHIFSVPKDGNTSEENEDAWSVSKDQTLFVLSDGASEGVYSREWANYLCHKICELNPSEITLPLLIELGQHFKGYKEGDKIPWYVENKMQETGSAATLLYLRFHKKLIGQKWEVGGIGDTCALLFQNNQLKWSWPINRGEDFNTSPDLVYNLPDKTGDLKSQTVPIPRGKSRLILSTDAMAEAFVSKKVSSIPEIKNKKEFQVWIEELRKEKKIKNDDTTMMMIEIEN